jgi:hypothetical protein
VETRGNPCISIWKPIAIVSSETRGNPWTTNPWVSMGFHILWKHMETYGHLYGNPWQLLHRKLVETHGHQTHGFPWVSTSYGNTWKPMDTSMETHGNCSETTNIVHYMRILLGVYYIIMNSNNE